MKAKERLPAMWAALATVAKKESRRDLLEPGTSARVSLLLSGQVGRGEVAQGITGELVVNPDTTRSRSSTPDAAALVARLLSKLPELRRVRLVRELPEEFAKAGCLAVEPEDLAAAKSLLERLRAKENQSVRGAVVFGYQLDRPEATAHCQHQAQSA